MSRPRPVASAFGLAPEQDESGNGSGPQGIRTTEGYTLDAGTSQEGTMLILTRRVGETVMERGDAAADSGPVSPSGGDEAR